ncbi:hypothetical protein EAH79_15630 [Sphingomonas koreensis]|nr:hypothetical protein EAH79_15630 [Sphingomonas koreensis]
MAAGRSAVLLIWSFCFLAGAFNHSRDLIDGGLRVYTFAPLPLAVFWSALLPIDLLVVLLLWTRRAIGLWLGLAVMTADVAANSWFAHVAAFPALAFALQLQTLFLGFVIGSIGWVMPRGRER